MIPDDFIQTLLSRTDIVEVIGRLVPLKKAGANYVACCPFHKEKTPSFSVSPSKQFYHCFGCGAHGTAIGFVMAYSGKTFPEAIEELAQQASLIVPKTTSQNPQTQRVTLNHFTRMATAADFYRTRLHDSPAAIAYLKKRGLSGEIVKRYGVGYAPDDWQALKSVFTDYDVAPLNELGLVIEKEDRRRYDRFRDRIMFPILDSRGQTIAFGGRIMEHGEPKYLNSPETPLFSKGRELYGLHQARGAIRQKGCALVVEGYMDVLALAQHGVNYCVATLGTATTVHHTQKLYRLTDSIIFCFDGDAAGRQAAWRALTNTLSELKDGKRAAFLFLPDGLDPDDFIRRHGRKAFEEAFDQAIPLSEYLLSELSAQHSPRDAEGRAAFIDALRPLLAAIKAPALTALIRSRMAAITGLPESELRTLLQEQNIRPSASPEKKPAQWRAVRRSPSLMRKILQAVVQQPHLTKTHDIPYADDHTPEAATLNAVVAYCHQNEMAPSVAVLIQHFSNTEHARLIAEALATNEAQHLSPELNTLQLMAALQRWEDRSEKQELAELLKRPLAQLNEEERLRLAQMRKKPPSPAPISEKTVTTANLPTHVPDDKPAVTSPDFFDEDAPPF